jgi:hypothetical protein
MSAPEMRPLHAVASGDDQPPFGGWDVRSCGDCRYFDASLEQRGPHGIPVGFCLRYPPTLHGIAPGTSVGDLPLRVLASLTVHPVVHAVQDACGEFEGWPE